MGTLHGVFVGIHNFNLNAKQLGKESQRFTEDPTFLSFRAKSRNLADYPGVAERIERCLDYARHDKNSFFAIEIIGLLTLDDDAIGG